ncbi:hypothetical protein QTV43_000623 [Vibrio vulnificus]|nr:hypothetical protein [Vibrio vulnificus]
MNTTKFCILAFTEKQVLDAINNELETAGKKTEADRVVSVEIDNKYLICETTRHATLVVKFDTRFGYATIGIKSISKIVNKRKGWTMLFNGQPGRNLTSLVFNGENGKPHTSSIANLKECMIEIFGRNLKQKVEDQVQFECSLNPALV